MTPDKSDATALDPAATRPDRTGRLLPMPAARCADCFRWRRCRPPLCCFSAERRDPDTQPARPLAGARRAAARGGRGPCRRRPADLADRNAGLPADRPRPPATLSTSGHDRQRSEPAADANRPLKHKRFLKLSRFRRCTQAAGEPRGRLAAARPDPGRHDCRGDHAASVPAACTRSHCRYS